MTHLASRHSSESGHQVAKIMDAFSVSLQHVDFPLFFFPFAFVAFIV